METGRSDLSVDSGPNKERLLSLKTAGAQQPA